MLVLGSGPNGAGLSGTRRRSVRLRTGGYEVAKKKVVPRRGPAGLLLAHGAGGDRNHRVLLALDAALDIPIRRINFPYRQEGRRAPDRAPKLVAYVQEQAADFAAELHVAPRRILFGGRSMGGRICSMAVAEGMPAAGLLLLSYPLHPPGKPDKLRVSHFKDIACPTVFVSGTRDPFGTPDEFRKHMRKIKGKVSRVWLEGARHDPKKHDDQIVAGVHDWLTELRQATSPKRSTST